MPHSTEQQLHWIIIFIPFLGLCAQWMAWFFRVPTIVLLTAFGLIFGPGLGIIEPQTQFGDLYLPIVKLCVALILFEGGLSLRLYELRDAANGVKRLIFPGIPIAWGLYSLCTHFIGGIDWPLALIFGAIIVVSGPTVIIPLLRQARLKQRPASYIKWEGIVNDPLGALLAVLVFQYFVFSSTGESLQTIFWAFVSGTSIALITGVGGGYLLARAFRYGWVPEYLKPSIVLSGVLLAYAASNAMQEEAGLLATTLFGIVISNVGLPSIDEVRRFNESLSIIFVSIIFIMLSANIEFNQLLSLDISYWLLLFVLIFIARPLMVFLSTIRSKMTFKERVLLSCVAPRGIVAASVGGVFAYELEINGFPNAEMLFPMVFALIVATVVIHGFSLSFIAKKLGLASEKSNGLLILGASSWSIQLALNLLKHDIKVRIIDNSWHRLKPARMENIPHFYGQILSETADENIDLSEIGYMVAVTDNDAFNAPCCSHFSHKLNRHHVFQLPMHDRHVQDTRGGLHSSLSGQILFSTQHDYDNLIALHYQGYRFQSTHFTEEYTPEQYKSETKKTTIPILLVKANHKLAFFTASQTPNIEIGDVLIAYAPNTKIAT